MIYITTYRCYLQFRNIAVYILPCVLLDVLHKVYIISMSVQCRGIIYSVLLRFSISFSSKCVVVSVVYPIFK